MITKEQARYIFNLYSQIETTESIIEQLKGFVKDQGENVPAIIDKSYTPHGSIEISIPYFESGKFDKNRGARVFNISYTAALLVLEDHLLYLQEELKKEGVCYETQQD